MEKEQVKQVVTAKLLALGSAIEGVKVTFALIRESLAEANQAAEEMEELMFDEETWEKLNTFITAVSKMQHLRKHARSKKEMADLRELEKLVNKACENFKKSMSEEEV